MMVLKIINSYLQIIENVFENKIIDKSFLFYILKLCQKFINNIDCYIISYILVVWVYGYKCYLYNLSLWYVIILVNNDFVVVIYVDFGVCCSWYSVCL